ncbi:hypothetical protein [Pseudomonas fluorescens]|uniref:hypothetical protein n=1 Tax=Pseudomonas fluorescens TaxID=294 RepID=UPI000A416D8A|nr:hypothetical protein [Pseudomonas fluorescens]
MTDKTDLNELGHELGREIGGQVGEVINAFVFIVHVLKAQPGFDVGFFDQYIKNLSAELDEKDKLTKLIFDQVVS